MLTTQYGTPSYPNPSHLTAATVHIVEYERGWGSRLEDVIAFASRADALSFCEDFNKDNTDDVVPDWYMVARIV